MFPEDYIFEEKQEYELSSKDKIEIAEGLRKAFGSYPNGRHYYHQIPSFRYLIRYEGKIVGHMGVDHRVVNNDGQVSEIFGIVDLFVFKEHQKIGLASGLLSKLRAKARKYKVDFLVSITKDGRLYSNAGFKKKKNRARWAIISEDRLFALREGIFEQSLWILEVRKEEWKKGYIDFLGPLF